MGCIYPATATCDPSGPCRQLDFLYMAMFLSPSGNLPQSHAVPCRYGGAPLSPTPCHPWKRKEKRKNEGKTNEKVDFYVGPSPPTSAANGSSPPIPPSAASEAARFILASRKVRIASVVRISEKRSHSPRPLVFPPTDPSHRLPNGLGLLAAPPAFVGWDPVDFIAQVLPRCCGPREELIVLAGQGLRSCFGSFRSLLPFGCL